jgi:hypothetical protein
MRATRGPFTSMDISFVLMTDNSEFSQLYR